MDSEVQTKDIVSNIFDSGKMCYIPKYANEFFKLFYVFVNNFFFRYTKSAMSMVKIKSVEDLESLPKTKWNISQPAYNDIREDALETGICYRFFI